MKRNQDTAYIKNQLSVRKDDIQGIISHPPLQTELTDEMLIESSNLPTVPSPPFLPSLPPSLFPSFLPFIPPPHLFIVPMNQTSDLVLVGKPYVTKLNIHYYLWLIRYGGFLDNISDTFNLWLVKHVKNKINYNPVHLHCFNSWQQYRYAYHPLGIYIETLSCCNLPWRGSPRCNLFRLLL